MNLAKKLISLYAKNITGDPIRWDTDRTFQSIRHYHADLKNHLKWMLSVLKERSETWHPTKTHRWIGFIQGALWASGEHTIDELREHMNSCKEE